MLMMCAWLLGVALTVTTGAQPTQHVMTDGTAVSFPPLTISGSQLAVDVTYDNARRVYRYAYTVTAPLTNQAAIDGIHIDVSGRIVRPQTDTVLQEDVRRMGQLQPATAIPVGITVQNPSLWRGGVGKGSNLYVATPNEGAGILPGTTFRFVVESKLPPGERKAEIRPSIDSWFDVMDTMPATDEEFEEPPDERKYYVKTTTIGPSDPDESTLFNGGGQSPAEVNPFLRYFAPTDTRTKLAAGASSYTLVVKFGTTTRPETFTATLNGVDVKARFQPMPGGVNAVKFNLAPGTNKVQLSIEGVTSSGRTARDTDTLTLLVP
jgi:hypothetical protein